MTVSDIKNPYIFPTNPSIITPLNGQNQWTQGFDFYIHFGQYFVCFRAEISGNLGPESSISGSKIQAQGPAIPKCRRRVLYFHETVPCPYFLKREPEGWKWTRNLVVIHKYNEQESGRNIGEITQLNANLMGINETA